MEVVHQQAIAPERPPVAALDLAGETFEGTRGLADAPHAVNGGAEREIGRGAQQPSGEAGRGGEVALVRRREQ